MRKVISICVVIILLLETKVFCQSSAAVDTNALIRMVVNFSENLATNPPLSDEDFTNKLMAIYTAYRQEKIDKGVAMAENYLLEDNRVQFFYGKVIDQYGQSVVGVEATGGIARMFECKRDERQMLHIPTNDVYKTQTDAEGLFQFIDMRGWKFGVSIGKKGYEMSGRGESWQGPRGSKTSPNDRAILTMWKLKGPEPMVHSNTDGLPYWYSFLKPNGDVARINLMTCRDAKYSSEKDASDKRRYDLEVGLHRDELIKTNANRVLFCNWSATIGISNGGLIEIATNNIYPYEAPADGYQPSVTLNFPTNVVGWTDEFKKRFFFKSENEKAYGRMTIAMDNEGRSFHLEIYANPNGSRNLEFDPQKWIYPDGRKVLR